MIHPTAVVDPSSQLAPGVEVGPLAYIGPNCILHEGVRIGAQATVECYTEIGEGTLISPNAHLGGPPQDVGYKNEATKLVVGKNCVIREFVTIHRATTKENWVTTVGDNCYIMAYVHIAHDCKIGSNVTIVNYTGLSGHIQVEDFAFISGHVGTHQFIRIGTSSMLSGMSRTSKDVLPYCTVLDDTIVAINNVGMRRRGIAPEVRAEIKKAVNIFTDKSLLVEEAKEKLKELTQYPEIVNIRNFIESTKRGISRNTSWSENKEYD